MNDRRRTDARRRRNAAAAVVVEAVERRALLSATLTNGVLAVTGTNAGDTIGVTFAYDGPNSGVNGDQFNVTVNGVAQSFAASGVTSVTVTDGFGADAITITQTGSGNYNVPMTVSGGGGADTIAVHLNTGPVYPAVNDVGVSIDGGAGNDTISFSAPDSTAVASAPVAITGGDGDDTITVSGGAVVTVDGGTGNDTISANTDVGDALSGGDGDDTLSVVGDSADTSVSGGDGTDLIYYAVPGNYALPDDIENAVANVTGDVTLIGNNADNVLTVTATGAVTVLGGYGNDRITATGASVYESGDDGNDTLVGTGGHATFSGGDGTDAVDFSTVTDPVKIYLDNALPSGTAAQIANGAGDAFDGTVEQAYGGSGNDLIVGTRGANALFGNGGNDTLVSNGGTDALFGGTGNDTLVARRDGTTYIDVADTDPSLDTVTGVATVNPGISAGATLLAGSPYGAGGTTSPTIVNAFDGDLDTAVAPAPANGGGIGVDLGSAQVITQFSFAPDPTAPATLVGGSFQASNTADFSAGVVTLYTVASAPQADVLTTVSTGVTAAYRYARFVGAAGAYVGLAEMQVFGMPVDAAGPTTGTVSGSVYVDANGDGTRDGGEAALAGQSVYLDVNNDGVDDPGDPSATTGSDGTFTITAVPPGTYALRQVLPSGYTQSGPPAGSYTVIVTAGGNAVGNAFGDQPIGTPTAMLGAVTGIVFDDSNDDGARGAGEHGMAGQTVFLDGSATLTSGDLSAVTDHNGGYTIANVPAGTYTLRQVLVAGYAQTLPATVGYAITVASGTTTTAPAFGDYLAPHIAPLPAATLSAAILTAPAARVVGGAVATTRVRITNSAADLFSGPVTVAIYASPDGTLSSSAALAGSVTGKQLKLKPGKSATVAVRFTYPTSVPSGTYQLVAAVTPTSAVASSAGAALTQPATGVAPRAVAVAAPAVDLSVSLPTVKVRQGRSVVIAVRVVNAGNTAAVGPVNVTLYASTAGVVDANAIVLNTVGAAVNLKPGKAAAIRVPFTAPANLAPGSYKLIAVITSATTPVDNNAADDTADAVTRGRNSPCTISRCSAHKPRFSPDLPGWRL